MYFFPFNKIKKNLKIQTIFGLNKENFVKIRTGGGLNCRNEIASMSKQLL